MVTLLDKSVSRQRQTWGYMQTLAHTDKPRHEEQRWNKVGKKNKEKGNFKESHALKSVKPKVTL